MTSAGRGATGDGWAARPGRYGVAAIALLVLSAVLMVGPVFFDAFACTSVIGRPTLGLGPHPMWVRPVACAFGSAFAFLGIGFAGLVIATAWAVHARQRWLAVVAGTSTLTGAAWLFIAVGGLDLVQRLMNHLARILQEPGVGVP